MRKSAIALAVVAVLAMSAGSAMAERGSRYGGHGRRGHAPSVHRAPVYQQGHHGVTVYRSYGYPSVYRSYGYPSVYRSYHPNYRSPQSGFYYRGPGFGISIGF